MNFLHIQCSRYARLRCAFVLILLLITGCVSPAPADMGRDPEAADMTDDHAEEDPAHADRLSELAALNLAAGELLQVVASTNIIADVVAQVGGERIDLFTLIPVGADPHSFEPAPRDLLALNEAHAIFINGLGLEEQIESIIDSLEGAGVVVSVNTGVETTEFDGAQSYDEEEEHQEGIHDEDAHDAGDDKHSHGGADPHTWFSIHAVEQWVDQIEHILSALDPANADIYATNAAAYLVELEALAEELEAIVAELPAEKRKLVTDHDSFGYFAAVYGFEVVGAVVPSVSTLASPSAGELARLQDQIEEEGVAAIFVGTTVTPDIVQQLATDAGVRVVILFTGSLSAEHGPAASYVDFMRYNMTAIVNALKE